MKTSSNNISAQKRIYKILDRIMIIAIILCAIFVISLLLTFSTTHMMREGLSFHAPVNIVLPFCVSCLSGGMGILHHHAHTLESNKRLAKHSNALGKEENTS